MLVKGATGNWGDPEIHVIYVSQANTLSLDTRDHFF